MVHIKEPLLLIGNSNPCGGSGCFLSRNLNGHLPYYVRRHITVNKIVLSASLNKTFTSYQYHKQRFHDYYYNYRRHRWREWPLRSFISRTLVWNWEDKILAPHVAWRINTLTLPLLTLPPPPPPTPTSPSLRWLFSTPLLIVFLLTICVIPVKRFFFTQSFTNIYNPREVNPKLCFNM